MGRTGVCWDNAVAESFFATYKKELIHTRPWPTIDQLKTATFSWIETYYNRARRHSTLNYLTPLEYELGFRGRIQAVIATQSFPANRRILPPVSATRASCGDDR